MSSNIYRYVWKHGAEIKVKVTFARNIETIKQQRDLSNSSKVCDKFVFKKLLYVISVQVLNKENIESIFLRFLSSCKDYTLGITWFKAEKDIYLFPFMNYNMA